jgi:hypothetical protein
MLSQRLFRWVFLASEVALTLGVALQPASAGAQDWSAVCERAGQAGVQVPLVIVPGDLDRDGDVDIFDYNILVTDYGQTGPNLRADINHDQRVNEIDYRILVRMFGFRSPCR